MIVVCNSGPLMALAKVGRLALLPQLYGVVWLPTAVYMEVVVQGRNRNASDAFLVAEAIRYGHLMVKDGCATEWPPAMTDLPLDAGEKHVLHLARSEHADLVLLDDLKARTIARAYGLRVKGTLGVIVQAYRASLLQLDDVRHMFATISERDDIWIAGELCRQVLSSLEAGETTTQNVPRQEGVE